LALSTCLTAGDWPQILGPHRNGEADDETLAEKWPADGPKTVWQMSVGRGFAGLAVVGNNAVLFHRVENEEIVQWLDAATGKPGWRFAAPTSYEASIVSDDGPRCVPVIHGDKVIAFGAQGKLHCLALKDGAKLWSRDTHAEFAAQEGYFGAGSSPIVEDDKVIVNVGGARAEAGIVAFSLKTGDPVWKATKEAASYSSPVAVTVGGVRHLIVVTRLSAVSLDPATGAVRFEVPFGLRGPTVNGANPTVIEDRLFLTASYGMGAVYGRIGAHALETLWSSDDVLSSQYATCVQDAGLLFGIHGRQDAGAAALRCIDPEKKEIRWEIPSFGYATLIKADGKLLILKTNGELVLAEVNGKSFHAQARAEIFENETRALPALSRGRLFARDTRTLKCVELGKQ
jgi:outer membrane protein assembly factor BamB